VLYQLRTDVEVQDISPGGDRFLIAWDNPATEPAYDAAIGWIGPGEPEPHLVKQLPAFAGGKWSPDGLAIAIRAHGAGDSLHVFSPDGVRLAQLDAKGMASFSWCPDGSILLIQGPGRRGLIRYYPRNDSLGEPLRIETVGWSLLCGPDGRFAALRVVRDGLAALSVVDLANGRTTSLPDSVSHLEMIAWLPERVAPIPTELRLPDTVTLRTGGRWRPTASVVFSDSSSQRVSAAFSSSDTRVLAIAPGGVAIANSPGTAMLRARYERWLSASMEVTVTHDQDSALLLSDDFGSVDTAKWELTGAPHPVTMAFDGDTVLFLNGDGNFYNDGLATRQRFSAAAGLTAELEFRLKPTRKDRQRVMLALCPLPGSEMAQRGDCSGLGAFAKYPSGELADFNEKVASLDGFGDGSEVSIGNALPSEQWTHLALQLYPDGYVELVLDRHVVARSRLRHPNPNAQPWRVYLFGSSVDTRVLARDLRVWRGVRY
jgi:hypothetical protein